MEHLEHSMNGNLLQLSIEVVAARKSLFWVVAVMLLIKCLE